jgi:hypothetical protein
VFAFFDRYYICRDIKQIEEVDSSKICNNDRTEAYNLKTKVLKEKREQDFAPLILLYIVAKFGSN